MKKEHLYSCHGNTKCLVIFKKLKLITFIQEEEFKVMPYLKTLFGMKSETGVMKILLKEVILFNIYSYRMVWTGWNIKWRKLPLISCLFID